MNTLKRLLVNFAAFAAVFGLLYLILPFDLSSLTVKGWGWVVVIVSSLSVSVVLSVLEGFVGGMIGDSVEVNPQVVYVGHQILSWITVGAGFVVAAWLAPSLVSAAAVPVLTYWGILGLASGVADLITERLGYGSKRRRS